MQPRRPLPPHLRIRPFSVRDGYAAGVHRGRLRGNDLRSTFRGVRVPADLALTEDVVRAAFLARSTPGHIFSHVTAARIWLIPLPARFTPGEGVHVSVRWPRTPARGPGVTGHRISDPRVGSVHRSGVFVVDAASTWCHLASTLSHDDLVAAGDHLVLTPAKQNPLDPRPYVSVHDLEARAASYRGPGAQAARKALADVRDGAESRQETRLRLILQRSGFPEPELNVDVFAPDGRWIGRFDQVHPRWKVIVEYDGEQHRLDDRQYDRDEIKIEGVIQAGWSVVRIRKDALRGTASLAIARVDRALHKAGWRP